MYLNIRLRSVVCTNIWAATSGILLTQGHESKNHRLRLMVCSKSEIEAMTSPIFGIGSKIIPAMAS